MSSAIIFTITNQKRRVVIVTLVKIHLVNVKKRKNLKKQTNFTTWQPIGWRISLFLFFFIDARFFSKYICPTHSIS